MARYVALLRGINVGGKNAIRMADLKAAFEGDGFERVSTYIQSGNVLFESAERSAAALSHRIEALLAGAFDHRAPVVLRNRRQMRAVVGDAPPGFGADPAAFRSDVLFLMPPLRPGEALRDVPTREGVDRAWTGPGVLYFERRADRAAQSRLTRITSLPIYQRLTIRNWNTTTKLLDLMEEE